MVVAAVVFVLVAAVEPVEVMKDIPALLVCIFPTLLDQSVSQGYSPHLVQDCEILLDWEGSDLQLADDTPLAMPVHEDDPLLLVRSSNRNHSGKERDAVAKRDGEWQEQFDEVVTNKILAPDCEEKEQGERTPPCLEMKEHVVLLGKIVGWIQSRSSTWPMLISNPRPDQSLVMETGNWEKIEMLTKLLEEPVVVLVVTQNDCSYIQCCYADVSGRSKGKADPLISSSSSHTTSGSCAYPRSVTRR